MTDNTRNVFLHWKHISAQDRSDPCQSHTHAKDKNILLSLWSDTFVPFCSHVNFSKPFFFPVFLFSPSFPNTFTEFGQFWQVRTHFFWAGAAAVLEVLITNRRVAVKKSQPFPLGNQCSSSGIPCSGKGRVSDPWRNSLIKTKPWCSFFLEDKLPASSRRLLARKYPSKGAFQSLQLFLLTSGQSSQFAHTPRFPVLLCQGTISALLCLWI